jgi:hypothetical protein
VGGINTANPTHASAVDGQINQLQAQVLNIVNHDATLAALAVGPDGASGFVALPAGASPGGHDNGQGHDVVASGDHDHGQSHVDIAAVAHFAHLWT